jgi:putative DNA primase/helicase
MTRMLDAALACAARGTPIFPCNFADKYPLTKHGLYDASTDISRIEHWWRVWPRAMIGVPTGASSGWWVLDLDVDAVKAIDGQKAMARLVVAAGHALPTTLTSITPRGGRHHFFRWKDVEVRNSVGKLGAGIDVRGAGGFVIVPPSVRIDGAAYRWENEGTDIAEAPTWLSNLVRQSCEAASRRVMPVIDLNEAGGPPERLAVRDYVWARAALERECAGLNSNHALNVAAFNLGQIVGGGGLSEQKVFDALLIAAEARGLIVDYGEFSVRKTIKSGLTAGMKYPRGRS